MKFNADKNLKRMLEDGPSSWDVVRAKLTGRKVPLRKQSKRETTEPERPGDE